MPMPYHRLALFVHVHSIITSICSYIRHCLTKAHDIDIYHNKTSVHGVHIYIFLFFLYIFLAFDSTYYVKRID